MTRQPATRTPLVGTRSASRGTSAPRWAAWFDGLTLTHDGDGTTRIHGPVVDQAALYGLLAKLRDIGLPLISVTQQEGDPHSDHRPTHPDHRSERSPDGLE